LVGKVSAAIVLVSLAAPLAGCSSGTSGIPPCNAWIFLFGAADLTLDCPATNAIKLFEREKVAPPP
jgi:hypothetical protein